MKNILGSTLYPEKTDDDWLLEYSICVDADNDDELIEAIDAIFRFFKYMNTSDSEQVTALQVEMSIYINYLGREIEPIMSYPLTYDEAKADILERCGVSE